MKPSFLNQGNKPQPTTRAKSAAKPKTKAKAKTVLKAKVKSNTKPKPKAKKNTTKTKTPIPTRSRSRAKTKTTATKRPRQTKRVRAKTQEEPPEPGFFSCLTRYTLLILLAVGALLYIKRDSWGMNTLIHSSEASKPKPRPQEYATLTSDLNQQREQLKNQYLRATTNSQKQQIINQASALLEDTLPKMMRCWLGHPYDFHGTATTPGKGKIACGYYVSAVMLHAGFKIDRIPVAQQPSQNIIRTFVDNKSNYEVKSNTPYPKYLQHITSKYEGIQIVGLDTHVAFIVIKNGKMRYIHASGGASQCVVDEDQHNASSLRNSKYRVISNISRNPNVIQKWILGIPFHTGGAQASR